jgi:hypothetical protein
LLPNAIAMQKRLWQWVDYMRHLGKNVLTAMSHGSRFPNDYQQFTMLIRINFANSYFLKKQQFQIF